MAKIKVVCIGRTYCSGGSAIGKLAAEELGVKCFDRQIVEMAASLSGISMEEINKYEEALLNPLTNPISLIGRNLSGRIFDAETKVIYDIVNNEGSCVIVGRCADFILKNKVRTLNVFINSDREKRISCAMKEHDIKFDDADAQLKRYDRKRADYYNANTTKKWGDMLSYDLVLNSGTLGYDLCAKIIAGAVRASE